MLYCLKILPIYSSTLYIVITIIICHNVLITSYLWNGTSKAKSSEVKESVCLLDAQKYVLIFQKKSHLTGQG